MRFIHLLLALVASLTFVRAQSCPQPGSTFNESFNAAVNAYDNGAYSVYPCSCQYDANEFYGVRPVGEGYCLVANQVAVTWYLVYQTDTLDYKWYPAWDQYVMAAANTNYEANPTCTVPPGASPMGSSWQPAAGYNATSKFQLTKRCNIGATYCSITGKSCIALSTFASLEQTAFDVQGVACTDNYNGQPFWAMANVLLQWKRYQFEQCWASSIATRVQTGTNGGGGNNNNNGGGGGSADSASSVRSSSPLLPVPALLLTGIALAFH